MSEKVLVVNPHLSENPKFVGKLVEFLTSLGITPYVMAGYDDRNLLDENPSCVFLTGVPAEASYSLAQVETQKL